MTNYVQLTDLNAPAGAMSATYVPGSGDNFYVKQGVVITNANGTAGSCAILFGNSSQSLFLDGTAYGTQAIRTTFGGGTIYIGETGRAVGTTGIYTQSDIKVFNDGMINAETGIQGSYLTVHNNGKISSTVALLANNQLLLTNTGEIRGTISVQTPSDFWASKVVNAGIMSGSLSFGMAHDLYDGRSGQFLGSIYMNDGQDTMIGGAGAETVYGGSGEDEIDTGGGDDQVYLDADRATDTIDGGDGIDTVNLFYAVETRVNLTTGVVRGPGYGHDLLSGFECVIGSFLNDGVTGDIKDNRLTGGGGDDTLAGLGGNDRLLGNAGNDRLDGGDGNDRATGGDGADTILGGAGVDIIIGGAGIDTLSGGTGTDQFIYRTVEEINTAAEFAAGMVERITDFDTNGDIIDLSMIDWNPAPGLDDAFVFVGNVAITGAGQLAVRQASGGNTFVEFSLTDSAIAGRIQLNGLITLDAADFLL